MLYFILIGFFLAFVFRKLSRYVHIDHRKFLRWTSLFSFGLYVFLWFVQQHYKLPVTTTPEDITNRLLNDPNFPQYLQTMQNNQNAFNPFLELTLVLGLGTFLLSFVRETPNSKPSISETTKIEPSRKKHFSPVIVVWLFIFLVAMGLFLYNFGFAEFLKFGLGLIRGTWIDILFLIILVVWYLHQRKKRFMNIDATGGGHAFDSTVTNYDFKENG